MAAEERVGDLEIPAALIKTEVNGHNLATGEAVGGRYHHEKSIGAIDFLIRAFLRAGSFRGSAMDEIVDRFVEIKSAYADYSAHVEAARQRAGLDALEAEEEAANEAETELRLQDGQARARTIPGPLAILVAVTDAWGRDNLERRTVFDADGGDLSFQALAFTVLRDGAVLMDKSGSADV